MDNLDMNEILLHNDTLSAEDKDKKIDKLGIPFKCKHILIYKFHITKLKELLLFDSKKLKEEFDNYNEFRRDLLYKEHLILYDDLQKFKDSELDLNVALMPIMSLSLSRSITKKIIATQDYFFLGDIITANYNDIAEIRGLGRKYIQELKDYIHSLGYKIKNEKETLYEKIDRLHSEGVKTIDQEYKIDPAILEVLFENEIYTKEDFINMGIGIFYIPGMTAPYRGRLLEIVHTNNINLDNYTTPDDLEIVNKNVTKQLENINDKIKKKIKYKESLLKKITSLKEEKERLIKEEQLIDEKLNSIIDEIKGKSDSEVINHARK